jgi:hypothetical protein
LLVGKTPQIGNDFPAPHSLDADATPDKAFTSTPPSQVIPKETSGSVFEASLQYTALFPGKLVRMTKVFAVAQKF